MITAHNIEEHRRALTGHCYRMLGSAVEADDAVQETMLQAWRGIERFDEYSSLRTWLYRISTNVCLDALSERSRRERRERPIEAGSEGSVDDPLESRPRTHWIEPISDAAVIPADADPAEKVMRARGGLWVVRTMPAIAPYAGWGISGSPPAFPAAP